MATLVMLVGMFFLGGVIAGAVGLSAGRGISLKRILTAASLFAASGVVALVSGMIARQSGGPSVTIVPLIGLAGGCIGLAMYLACRKTSG